ncbi:hypothetical protein [Myxococcus sp. RHSTA-1-4]|uniref:hypothetical protein n=1 Tax=Myxococcus sp. RHSTA-1-4 TaxID=2874601 RepID=UPI001CBDD2F7|nr:hypothetical protein [Myxococcus sp. RHSTA-1-4]MBZ4419346.1 hypothetical protein [Myxococcus sp. RHSTA-1-4]
MPPGTRAYLSPEAWRHHREHAGEPQAPYDSTPKDDVYALGVVLFWLLTDRRAFHVTDKAGVDAVISQPPTAPHALNPRVPPELGALCLRLLEKQPADRPDAEAACEALEALLTREGAEWDVPLCEFHGVHNATTRPGPDADELAAWVNELREDVPPRRGRRPPRHWGDGAPGAALSVPEAAPPPPPGEATAPAHFAPAVPAAPPRPRPTPETASPGLPPPVAAPASVDPVSAEAAPGGTTSPGTDVRVPVRWRRGALTRALLQALVLAVAWLHAAGGGSRGAGLRAAPDSHGTVRDGETSRVFPAPWAGGWEDRKVAPPWMPPEADGAAVRPGPASTPAATASRAVTPEEPAAVKTSASELPSTPATGLSTVKRAVSVATACAALSGCVGAPPRPPPSAEPCPPGAIEAMESVGIYVGKEHGVTFHLEAADVSYITLHEGWSSVRFIDYFGELPSSTVLSGRIILGDRVYGRFTQAQVKGQSRPIPVCMELFNVKVKPDSGLAPNTVRILSTADVRVVDGFK